MVKLTDLLKDKFQNSNYSELDEINEINETILSELLDPDNSYEYKQYIKGLWTYYDMNNVEFFVRIVYQPITNGAHFELKTGWFDNKGKPQYEPSIPPTSPKSSAIDWDKRSNTVAKIYRDEVLPFFEKQNLSDLLLIKPISSSRMKFAERLVKKFTSIDQFDIEYGSPLIIKKK
jgi:hypothetical protein